MAGRAVPAAHRQAAGRRGTAVSLLLRSPVGPIAALPSDGNVLAFSLFGSGEIDLSLVAKQPGPTLALDVAQATIPLSRLPGADPLPPYVRLIHDVLLGDRSLFTRPDGLAAAWKVIEPLLAAPPRLASYPQGSWGPSRARRSPRPGAGYSGSNTSNRKKRGPGVVGAQGRSRSTRHPVVR